jgi:hypothetical protein
MRLLDIIKVTSIDDAVVRLISHGEANELTNIRDIKFGRKVNRLLAREHTPELSDLAASTAW